MKDQEEIDGAFVEGMMRGVISASKPNAAADLLQRCREVLEWDRTGKLDQSGALLALAKTMPTNDEGQNLRLAEDRTTKDAMKFVVAVLEAQNALSIG